MCVIQVCQNSLMKICSRVFFTSLINHCFCLSPISKCCVSSSISSRVSGCVSPRWCRVCKSKQHLLQLGTHFIQQLNHQKVTEVGTKLHFILITSPWIPKPDSIFKFLQINPIILVVKWRGIIRISVMEQYADNFIYWQHLEFNEQFLEILTLAVKEFRGWNSQHFSATTGQGTIKLFKTSIILHQNTIPSYNSLF